MLVVRGNNSMIQNDQLDVFYFLFSSEAHSKIINSTSPIRISIKRIHKGAYVLMVFSHEKHFWMIDSSIWLVSSLIWAKCDLVDGLLWWFVKQKGRKFNDVLLNPFEIDKLILACSMLKTIEFDGIRKPGINHNRALALFNKQEPWTSTSWIQDTRFAPVNIHESWTFAFVP